jgi:hypothetical protein
MKNQNLAQYFVDEMHNANGVSGYNNFSGVGSWADDQYSGFGGDYAFQYANGQQAPAAQPSPTSLPFIVLVQNSTTANIANVTIFNANVALGTDTSAFGNTAGIVITSGNSNVSYYKLLQTSKDKPFRVAQTYISSATAGQIQVQYSVVQIAANGVRVDTPITPNIDPYQLQTTVLVNTTQYIIDGDSSIVFASLLASTTVTFQLFPVNTANVTRTLTDSGVVNQLGSPQTIRNSRIQVVGTGMQSLQG